MTSIAFGVVQNLPYMYKEDGRSYRQDQRAKYGSYHAFSTVMNNQTAHKYEIPGFGYPLSMGNGILCWKERHRLLLKLLETFLICILMSRGAAHCIYNLLMVHTMGFHQDWLSNCSQNARFWVGTLSAWEMGCCAGMRDIHCWWGV